MRHTYRSWLDAVGTGIAVQQKLMRHSDIRTTLNVYEDVITDEMAQARAADRWSSSNDSPRHNSNFVLHRSWSPLHDITRPQPQPLARFSALRRSVAPSPLDTFFMPQSRIVFKRHFALAHARRLLRHGS